MKFIVIDGPDGAGKTTMLSRLSAWIRSRGIATQTVTDPGGTALGDKLRTLLLEDPRVSMTVRSEALLFMASRAQLIAEVIHPALERRVVVLGDRFVTSTLAYQASLPYQEVLDLMHFAIHGVAPDMTIILDVPAEVGLGRLHGRKLDYFEQRPLAFHQEVRRRFVTLGSHYPYPVRVVDATRTPDEVFDDVWQVVEEVLETESGSYARYAEGE